MTVIVVDPWAPTEVTVPPVPTTTRLGSPDTNVRGASGIGSPFASVTTAESWAARPTCTTSGLGVAEIPLGSSVTVASMLSVSSASLTTIVAFPTGPTEVSNPVADTVSTVGSLDSYVTVSPSSSFPAASTTLAIS